VIFFPHVDKRAVVQQEKAKDTQDDGTGFHLGSFPHGNPFCHAPGDRTPVILQGNFLLHVAQMFSHGGNTGSMGSSTTGLVLRLSFMLFSPALYAQV
jgi:hypothetical protein